jgi:hypothetical protein
MARINGALARISKISQLNNSIINQNESLANPEHIVNLPTTCYDGITNSNLIQNNFFHS